MEGTYSSRVVNALPSEQVLPSTVLLLADTHPQSPVLFLAQPRSQWRPFHSVFPSRLYLFSSSIQVWLVAEKTCPSRLENAVNFSAYYKLGLRGCVRTRLWAKRHLALTSPAGKRKRSAMSHGEPALRRSRLMAAAYRALSAGRGRGCRWHDRRRWRWPRRCRRSRSRQCPSRLWG